jgi:hypothetical protein
MNRQVDWILKAHGLSVRFYESSQSMDRLFFQQFINRLRYYSNSLIVYSSWRREERLFTLVKSVTNLELSWNTLKATEPGFVAPLKM